MRAGDLETRLSKAHVELKKLREQLVSAEATKLEAEQALAQAKKREGVRREEEKTEESVTSSATMDVFEVVVPTKLIYKENEIDNDQK
ncbi:interactor of constitutive active ROPs 4-like [Canna indica]|uniref:Interactor of constitutive active ROPs 4-like n=1 Tax=Canna indica TaxID=4628 RepID=A0AAQ3KME4_9LILI|nr:interactor of constitutive active ROPs 4-like [Canna indica]